MATSPVAAIAIPPTQAQSRAAPSAGSAAALAAAKPRCGGAVPVARCSERRLRDSLAHFLIILQQRGAFRAGRDMRFDLARMSGVELAIDQRL